MKNTTVFVLLALAMLVMNPGANAQVIEGCQLFRLTSLSSTDHGRVDYNVTVTVPDVCDLPGIVRINTRTGQKYPPTYNFDPSTGEELAWSDK